MGSVKARLGDRKPLEIAPRPEYLQITRIFDRQATGVMLPVESRPRARRLPLDLPNPIASRRFIASAAL
jgi:hypothetical protein